MVCTRDNLRSEFWTGSLGSGILKRSSTGDTSPTAVPKETCMGFWSGEESLAYVASTVFGALGARSILSSWFDLNFLTSRAHRSSVGQKFAVDSVWHERALHSFPGLCNCPHSLHHIAAMDVVVLLKRNLTPGTSLGDLCLNYTHKNA